MLKGLYIDVMLKGLYVHVMLNGLYVDVMLKGLYKDVMLKRLYVYIMLNGPLFKEWHVVFIMLPFIWVTKKKISLNVLNSEFASHFL